MIDVSVQLSLGRFAVSLDDADQVKAAKKKIRAAVPQLSHVNLNSFRVNVNGTYLSDESKSLKEAGVKAGDVLHFVKKSASPNAALDTEKKSEDE